MKTLSKLALGALVLAASFTAQAETRAVIETNMGNIGLSLDETKAPKTVANFVIDGFMIQGGGFTPDMVQKATDKAIGNEADNGLKNTVGTIAMARTGNPNSATSQFFINTADNAFLNFKNKTAQGYGYAVFGKVTSGMEVVEKIAKVQTTDRGYHQNVPVKPVVIRKVTIGQ